MYKKDDVIAGTYEVFSEPFDNSDRNQQVLAVKTLRVPQTYLAKIALNPSAEKKIEEEGRFLKNHPHPCLARFSHPFPHDLFGVAYDFFEGETLTRVIKREEQIELSFLHLIAKKLFGVLAHLHNRGYVHGQIHPDHIIIGKNYDLRLTGIGNIRRMEDQGVILDKNLPGFTPPEQQMGHPCHFSVDVFSAWKCIACLLGSDPARWYELPDPSRIPEAIRKALEKGTSLSPNHRTENAIEAYDLLDYKDSGEAILGRRWSSKTVSDIIKWHEESHERLPENWSGEPLPGFKDKEVNLQVTRILREIEFNFRNLNFPEAKSLCYRILKLQGNVPGDIYNKVAILASAFELEEKLFGSATERLYNLIDPNHQDLVRSIVCFEIVSLRYRPHDYADILFPVCHDIIHEIIKEEEIEETVSEMEAVKENLEKK
ncbi:hypothetical protein KC644_03735 [Candidatus Berkelbacteria bacterium]|nr:hypothetical protein [Candidatus Berkelbacteria bacterium]